ANDDPVASRQRSACRSNPSNGFCSATPAHACGSRASPMLPTASFRSLIGNPLRKLKQPLNNTFQGRLRQRPGKHPCQALRLGPYVIGGVSDIRQQQDGTESLLQQHRSAVEAVALVAEQCQ